MINEFTRCPGSREASNQGLYAACSYLRDFSRAAGARLLEEKLREQGFPSVDFRNTSIGRLAFIKGHRLAVWQVALIAPDYGSDGDAMAKTLNLPEHLIDEALNYATTYAAEIDPVVQEAKSATFDDLRRRLPSLQQSPV